MSQGPYQGNISTPSPTQSRPIKKPVSRRSSAINENLSYQNLTTTYSGKPFKEVIRDHQLGSSSKSAGGNRKSTDGKTGNGHKASNQARKMADAYARTNGPQSYQDQVRAKAAQRIQELKKDLYSSNQHDNYRMGHGERKDPMMTSYHPVLRPRPDQQGPSPAAASNNSGQTSSSAIEAYMAAQKAKALAALRGTQPAPSAATPVALPNQSHWASLRPVIDDDDKKNKDKNDKNNASKHGKSATQAKKASEALRNSQEAKLRTHPSPAYQSNWAASHHAHQSGRQSQGIQKAAQVQADLKEKEKALAALRDRMASHASQPAWTNQATWTNQANQAGQAGQTGQASQASQSNQTYQAYQAATSKTIKNNDQHRIKRRRLLDELMRTGSVEEVFLDTMDVFHRHVRHCLGGFALGTDGGDVHMCDCNGNYSLCFLQLFVDLAETHRR